MCTCSNKPHALVIHCEFAMRPTIIATTLMMVYDCCRVAGRAGGGAGGVGAAARHAARHVAASHRHRALVHGRHHRILGLRRRTTGQGPAESHRYVVSSRCVTQCVCVCVCRAVRTVPLDRSLPPPTPRCVALYSALSRWVQTVPPRTVHSPDPGHSPALEARCMPSL